jgi:predicted RNase H-related nuclease YkuK (DUF458 family)
MEFNYEEIEEFIKNSSEKTKFYIGADSQRVRKKKNKAKIARYVISIVAHIDGKHGARVFGSVEYHPIVDANLGKPFNRLFKEAELVVSTYERFYELLMDKNVELHIDVSSSELEGSYIAHNAAVGYIKGLTGITPKVKPDAFAASSCADHFVKAKHIHN